MIGKFEDLKTKISYQKIELMKERRELMNEQRLETYPERRSKNDKSVW